MNRYIRLISIIDGVATIENKRQNLRFLISEEDLKLMDICSWYISNTGYVIGFVNGKYEYLHVVIAGKPKKGMVIDHKDRNKINCTRQNLAEIIYQENVRNSDRMDSRKIKFFGVSWNTHKRAFTANVSGTKGQIRLTCNKNPIICAIAYDKWMLLNNRYTETNLSKGFYDIEEFGISSPLDYHFKSKYLSKESQEG